MGDGECLPDQSEAFINDYSVTQIRCLLWSVSSNSQILHSACLNYTSRQKEWSVQHVTNIINIVNPDINGTELSK